LFDTAKAVLRGKFIIMSAYQHRKISNQWYNVAYQTPRKQKLAKPKISNKEILAIMAKINEMRPKRKYKVSSKQKDSSMKK
jgi:hypothetical protein